MIFNEEEALGLFNRLLEQLHQAGINKIDNLVLSLPNERSYNYYRVCRYRN